MLYSCHVCEVVALGLSWQSIAHSEEKLKGSIAGFTSMHPSTLKFGQIVALCVVTFHVRWLSFILNLSTNKWWGEGFLCLHCT